MAGGRNSKERIKLGTGSIYEGGERKSPLKISTKERRKKSI